MFPLTIKSSLLSVPSGLAVCYFLFFLVFFLYKYGEERLERTRCHLP